MEKLLIICEKPSAAKNFSDALGGRSGTFNGKPYVIVNLFGHILEYGKPVTVARDQHKVTVGEFSNISGIPWSPDYFDFKKKALKKPVGDFDGAKQSFNSVKAYLDQGYIPVVASDLDSYCEGDLLVHEVLDACGYAGKRYREYHVDEEAPSILKAMSEMKDVGGDDLAYLTGLTRSAADFMTQQYTRLATITIQNKGYRLPAPVPFGRLQSAVLTFVGSQLDKITTYKPSSVFESRYKLDHLVLKNPEAPQFATLEEWSPGDLPSEATVRKVKETPGRTAPPKPLDLTGLSALMSKQGIPVKRTLELAQKMYETKDSSGKAYLSYPRTEEDWLTTEQFNNMLPHVDDYLHLLGLPTAAFTHRQPRSTHVKDKGSHGALRPSAIPESLESLDAKFGKGAGLIYKTVTERFLLMFLEDTEWVRYDYETVDTGLVFKGSLKVITKQGVVDPDAEVDKDVVTQLPELNQMAKLYAHEVKSTKPQNPTTDWLLKQLKKEGVGTPSTQSSTVARMVGGSDKHPVKDGKVLALNSIGQVGYEAAKGTLIGSVAGTKFMHECIMAVKKGTFTVEQALSKFNEAIVKDMQILKTKTYQLDNLGFEKQGPRDVAEGVWMGKKVAFNRIYGGYRFTDQEVETLLSGGEVACQINTRNGETDVVGKLNNLTYNGKHYVGYDAKFVNADNNSYQTGLWKGREIQIKKMWGEYTFTDDQLTRLFNDETITIQTKKGQFTGKLTHQTFKGRSFVGFKPEFQDKK